ncbi:Hypothetical predicted protein, partial [Xyrichtys novacula]
SVDCGGLFTVGLVVFTEAEAEGGRENGEVVWINLLGNGGGTWGVKVAVGGQGIGGLDGVAIETFPGEDCGLIGQQLKREAVKRVATGGAPSLIPLSRLPARP